MSIGTFFSRVLSQVDHQTSDDTKLKGPEHQLRHRFWREHRTFGFLPLFKRPVLLTRTSEPVTLTILGVIQPRCPCLSSSCNARSWWLAGRVGNGHSLFVTAHGPVGLDNCVFSWYKSGLRLWLTPQTHTFCMSLMFMFLETQARPVYNWNCRLRVRYVFLRNFNGSKCPRPRWASDDFNLTVFLCSCLVLYPPSTDASLLTRSRFMG